MEQQHHINKITRYLLASLLICTIPTGCSNQKSTPATFSQDIQQDTKTTKSAERSIFAMDTYMTISAYGERAQEAADASVQEIQRH